MQFLKEFVQKIANTFGYTILKNEKVINDEEILNIFKVFFKKEKNPIILDIGAYHGTFSSLFAEKYPNSSIYAFEPQKNNYIKCANNLKKYSNVNCYNKAITTISGKNTFYVTKESHSSSLLKPNTNFFKEQQLKDIEEVNGIKLKDFITESNIKTIHLMKIDIQGMELKIFEDNIDILDNIAIIMTEVNFYPQYEHSSNIFDLSNFLNKNNFQFYNIFDIVRKNKLALYSNIVFINKKLMITV